MNKIKKIKLKFIRNNSGVLIPCEIEKITKKKIVRFFTIKGKKGFTRGNHSHKKCSQTFFCFTGSVKLEIFNGIKTQKISLNSKSRFGIHVPPLHWVEVKFLSSNNCLLVFCDRKYEIKDYIVSKKQYFKSINV